METEQILIDANNLYKKHTILYRENMVEIGKKLQEYVYTKLKEVDYLTTENRQRAKLTRENLIGYCANKLNVDQVVINKLIKVAMSLELIGNNNPGNMSYDCICRFGIFIEREKICIKINGNKNKDRKPYSFCCIWKIKKEFEINAKKIYQETINNDLGHTETIHKIMMLVYGNKGAIKPTKQNSIFIKDIPDNMEQMYRAAKNASPGDVADMCMQIINSSVNPRMTMIKLMSDMEYYIKERKVI